MTFFYHHGPVHADESTRPYIIMAIHWVYIVCMYMNKFIYSYTYTHVDSLAQWKQWLPVAPRRSPLLFLPFEAIFLTISAWSEAHALFASLRYFHYFSFSQHSTEFSRYFRTSSSLLSHLFVYLLFSSGLFDHPDAWPLSWRAEIQRRLEGL